MMAGEKGKNMIIEVTRKRYSVTQGEATVCINGKEIITFSDTIEIISKSAKYYGDKIGDWASLKPDSDFILGALYHPLDNIYHHSDTVKKAIKEN